MKNVEIKGYINDIADTAIDLAQKIWEYAELNFREVKSAAVTSAALKANGFDVQENAFGIKTALQASFTVGTGGPCIAYLGEYDALSNLSQKAACVKCEPIVSGEAGHGCGHNLLGAGSFAAAVALKNYICAHNISATIKFFGCPAEEDGGGKTHMAKAGAFDDIDASFTWHPSSANYVVGSGSLAVCGVLYSFKGVSSHAAATPYAGRSALDAAELMSVGCNYLREHIIPEARIHYAYRDVGGLAPNVVQASACVHYYVRAPHVNQMLDILKRVDDVARGAALMTGTQLEIKIIDGVSDYLPNKALSELLALCMQEVGAPEFDDDNIALANEFWHTISDSERENNLASDCESINADKDYFSGKIVDNLTAPLFYNPRYAEPGSTDVGDVSYTSPTAQCCYACAALGTGTHSWQMTAQANSGIGMKGMLKAAEALALAGVKAINSPQILKLAKEQLRASVPNGYICPMPDGVTPEF